MCRYLCPEDYYDLKFIYGNTRVRIRHSQLIVNEPPRWIINTLNATVVKFGIDQQERDLKKGIYPNQTHFSAETEQYFFKLHFQGKESITQPTNQLYTQFYRDFKKWIENKGDAPVTMEDALSVIHILESITNNSNYKPISL